MHLAPAPIIPVGRDLYVSTFGGFSSDVPGDVVAVHPEAFRQAKLVPNMARAVVSVDGNTRYFLSDYFHVVPITPDHPAFQASYDGVVLPSAVVSPEWPLHRTYEHLRVGNPVRLNTLELPKGAGKKGVEHYRLREEIERAFRFSS